MKEKQDMVVMKCNFLATRVLWIPGHATPNTDTISPFRTHSSFQSGTKSIENRAFRSELTMTVKNSHMKSTLAAVGLRRSPNTTRTVVRTQSLEAVSQSLHVGVFVALELEAGRNDLGRPGDTRGVVVGLEHEVEVARVGRVDGKVVGAVPGVGLGVGSEPCLCR